LAALGVMAVTILLVFAMSGATECSLSVTGSSLADVQAQLTARSAADYALLLIAQKKMATDGKPQPFAIVTDQLRKRAEAGEVAVTEVGPEHSVYRSAGLVHYPGDALIHVISAKMGEPQRRSERWLLGNSAGKRLRPIDVTSLVRAASAK